jgi:hypothetical protein
MGSTGGMMGLDFFDGSATMGAASLNPLGGSGAAGS